MHGGALGDLVGRGDLEHCQRRFDDEAPALGRGRPAPGDQLGRHPLRQVEGAVKIGRAAGDLQHPVGEQEL